MISLADKTIPSLYRSAAQTHGERVAFNYFDGSWKIITYGELLALVEKITSSLLNQDLKKGDRVAIVSENRPEWCAAYLSALSAGGIVVPIDAQLGHEEIRNLLIDSEAGIVYCSSKTEGNVLKAIKDANLKSISFDLNYTPHPHPLSVTSDVSPEISSDDVAAIIYTSGTTGRPKGVMLTHHNLCSDAEAVIKANLVTEEDNVLAMLPLHHTYPCMCTFLVPLFIGATITFAPGLKAVELISAIKDKGVTVVVTVPRLLEMIRDGIISKIKSKGGLSWVLFGLIALCRRARRRYDVNIGKVLFRSVHRNFGRLRFFASGGAKLDASVMEDLESIGFTVLEGYGLTETSPVITFNPPEKRKPGSAGKPLPGAEIRVTDDGEITVRGPMVMRGYYRNERATVETLKDDWLRTGDTGFLDGDGYLFITGRKKEVIVLSSGKNVYPEDVEKAYSSIPLVKELCVTGVERRDAIDYLQAVIVPDLDYVKRASVGNINDALKWEIQEVSARLPEYMRIRGFTLHLEPLPRTPLGKLRRFMVAEIIIRSEPIRQADRGEDLSLTGDEIGRRVVECIRSVIREPVPVQSSDNLEIDLGFDSLKKIEFMACLEASLSISLPETFSTELQTVGAVVSRLREYVAVPAFAAPRGEPGRSEWKDILRREPSPDDIRKIGLSLSFTEKVLVYVLFILHKVSFRLLFRLTVRGGENIPRKGPFVIAANHVSYLDAFAIGASVSYGTFRNLSFLGLERFFRGGLRSWLARLSHVIPIDLETYLTRALQLSAYTLNKGKALCIFPEGGRSFDGTVMEFKKGIGALAMELNIPVIPAFISGSYEALPKGARFIRPAKIEVRFGRPLRPSDLDPGKKPPDLDAHQFFAEELRERVITLSDNRP